MLWLIAIICLTTTSAYYCIDRVGSATFVTKLDLLKGYWKVNLDRPQSCTFVGCGKVCLMNTEIDATVNFSVPTSLANYIGVFARILRLLLKVSMPQML